MLLGLCMKVIYIIVDKFTAVATKNKTSDPWKKGAESTVGHYQ